MRKAIYTTTFAIAFFFLSNIPAFGILYDNFENGVIDSSMWTVGGSTRAYYGGPGGSWQYLNDEVSSPDGYLRNQVMGPTSGATYGAEAWVRTNYDFNDGNNYIINFTWEIDLFDNYFNAFKIQISDGYIDPNWDADYWTSNSIPGTTDLLHRPAGSASFLFTYQYPDPNFGKESWSLFIDSLGSVTLYDSPNAGGSIISQEGLDPASSWYVRFAVIDATSAGFPAGGLELRLYDFEAKPSTVPEPSTLILFGVGLIGLAVSIRRKHNRGLGSKPRSMH